MKSNLRILILAAEADPFVKIGGLGDVAGSLPPALKALGGLDVRMAIPFHGAIHRRGYPLRKVDTFDIPHRSGPMQVDIYETGLKDVPVYLVGGTAIDPDAPVYTADLLADGHKFTFFSLAILEFTRRLKWQPHVIHANDWHTAPAVYAISLMKNEFYKNTATVMGVHNLPYLGSGAGPALQAFGLPPASGSALPWWAQDFPLPLGLLTADQIVAVSPNYAREILTPEFGFGLDEFLRSRAVTISGILNGINGANWDPQTDRALPTNYNLDTLDTRIQNKIGLQHEFNLESNPVIPLLAMVTRMDPQKGVDLLPEALRQISDLPWQVILLGTGTPEIEAAARRIDQEYPNRVRAAVRYDALLSRRIYGGADMLLIPSRYEPCGLTQMIAMRYGCVPVARTTGGLRDTIQDHAAGQTGDGFLFSDATAESLAGALRRALLTYQSSDTWRQIQWCGMQQDFTWERSANQYKDLYWNVYKRKTNKR